MEYKKGDYVVVNYEGEPLSGKILSLSGDKARVEVCISAHRGEELLTDEVTVSLSDIKKLNIKTKD